MNLHFKIAFRQMIRHKLYAAINIFGLSVGLAGFMLVLLYLNNEYSYERWNPVAKQVYRLQVDATDGTGSGYNTNSSPGETGPYLKEHLPGVESYVRFNVFEMGERMVMSKGNTSFYTQGVFGADSTFFDLFPYPFVKGDLATYRKTPNGVVLSEGLCQRIFNDTDPIGQTIRLNDRKDYTVCGVCRTVGLNTHFEWNIIRHLVSKAQGWNNWNFYVYLKLKPGVDAKALEPILRKTLFASPGGKELGLGEANFRLLPISDIHLGSHQPNEIGINNSKSTVAALSILGLMILLLACVNFTNLSIAAAARRAREVGLKKVFGDTRGRIVFQFLAETTISVCLSLIIALMLVELLLPAFNRLFSVDLYVLHLVDNSSVLWQLLLTLVLVILASGAYPAWYLSRYEPVMVLKGNITRSDKGLWLRKGLILFQFLVSAVFISGLLIIRQQLDHMQHKDLGFKPEQVLVVKINMPESYVKFPIIKHRLLGIDGVKRVSRCNYAPGESDLQTVGRSYENRDYTFSVITVSEDYFETLSMRMAKGRSFSTAFPSDSSGVVLNESAVRLFGMKEPVGRAFIEGTHIIGVVSDFNQSKMDQPVVPTIFWVQQQGTNPGTVLIHYRSEHHEHLINEIENVFKDYEGNFPFRYSYLDKEYGKLMEEHTRLNHLFLIFTVLTVFIAILGLYGLSAFVARQRTREITIRKVLGASTQQILNLVAREFVMLVILANVFAVPLVYYLSSHWLQGFAYRIGQPWWPYLFTFLFTLTVAALTVMLQSLKVARIPEHIALKYE